MSPFVKKLLQIAIAIILQLIDLFDGEDDNKVARSIKKNIHLVEDPKDLTA